MGFKNILKKATEKGLTAANEIDKKGLSYVQENEEATKHKQEEVERLKSKSQEEIKQIAEQKKKEQIVKITAPCCNRGDCLWNCGIFYFNCDDDINCIKKQSTKNRQVKMPKDDVLWPFRKRLEHLEKLDEEGKNIISNREEWSKDLFNEFMPSFSEHYKSFEISFEVSGISEDNALFKLLWDIKDKNIKLTPHMAQIFHYNVVGGQKKIHLNLDLDFYRNPSLYKRDGDDFDYTLTALETFSDREKSKEYIRNDYIINVNEFYDKLGNIKPAGYGGPEKGFDGDTLWNIVARWAEEDSNND